MTMARGSVAIPIDGGWRACPCGGRLRASAETCFATDEIEMFHRDADGRTVRFRWPTDNVRMVSSMYGARREWIVTIASDGYGAGFWLAQIHAVEAAGLREWGE